MKYAFFIAIATALIGASPSPKPSAAAQQRVTAGITINVTNIDDPDANGAFHCEYVTPAMRVMLGIPQRIVYWCAR